MSQEKLSISTRIPLSSGNSIPQFGFGVWQLGSGEEAKRAILWALEAGYRHFDTAAAYQNEGVVGEAIRESGVPREEIFITTKLANIHQRDGRQRHGFEKSLENLGLDYIDLYIQHWPVPGRYKESWAIMEDYYKQGLTKAIGLSNVRVSHLKEIMADATVMPAVDQIEFNPGIQDYETINFCKEHNIAVEAWSPLGGGMAASDPTIAAIAQKYGKSGPQVVLRWILQKGIIVFPRSSKQERIVQNADVFDFELAAEDCAKIDALNAWKRTGRDPDHPEGFIYRVLD